MRAAAVAVDGVAKRQRGRVELCLFGADFAWHLVEGDAVRLWRANAADQADPLQPAAPSSTGIPFSYPSNNRYPYFVSAGHLPSADVMPSLLFRSQAL